MQVHPVRSMLQSFLRKEIVGDRCSRFANIQICCTIMFGKMSSVERSVCKNGIDEGEDSGSNLVEGVAEAAAQLLALVISQRNNNVFDWDFVGEREKLRES